MYLKKTLITSAAVVGLTMVAGMSALSNVSAYGTT